MVIVLVALTVILCLAVGLIAEWVRLRRARLALKPRQAVAGVADLLVPHLQPKHFALPGGLFFHRAHTWANLLFSGQIKVGVDDFFQRLFGRIDAITLPPIDLEIKQGQPIATIRQGGRTATLVAPVDGVVCAVNGEVAKTPGLLRRDPYTRGWLVAVRPTNLGGNLSQLTVGEGALAWLEAEVVRLHEFLHVTLKHDVLVGATAADGGVVADGLLEHVDDETWAAFQSEFL